jgi:hypothetical protein
VKLHSPGISKLYFGVIVGMVRSIFPFFTNLTKKGMVKFNL